MNAEEKKLFDSIHEQREQIQVLTEKLFVLCGTEAKNILIVKVKMRVAQEHLGCAFKELGECERILSR